MTNILQISDTHITTANRLVSERLATDDLLEHLVRRLSSARAQWGTLDAIVATGDISDDGSEESYARFKSIIAPLNLPVFVIPGNHDAREPLRQAFRKDGYLPDSGPLNWHQKIGDVHVIGLDTLVEGKGLGRLLPESLHFLETTLSNLEHQPVLVTLHHPPFKCGIAFMDAIGLENMADFEHIIHAAQADIRIACGHIHNMMVASVGGRVALTSPAPCSNFEFDIRKDAPVGFYDRDDGCLLHCWNHGFQSIRIGPTSGDGPYPFRNQ